MTWDRLRMAGYVLAFVLVGTMLISLYGAFRVELEKSTYIGFIGGIVLGALMITLITIVLLVPERRASWVRAITSVNARYLFAGLIILWIAAMGFLASLNLSANSVGPPALVGMFAGIFIFMGFVWAVIGE